MKSQDIDWDYVKKEVSKFVDIDQSDSEDGGGCCNIFWSFDIRSFFLFFKRIYLFKKFRVYDKILFLWDGKAIAKSQKVLKNCHIYSILFQEFKRIFKNQNKEKIL